MDDPLDFSVDSLSAAYARRDLSPREALEACLDRVHELDEQLVAFRGRDETAARRDAQDSEQRWRSGSQRGPLDGVPTTVKDTMAMRGWATLKGSRQADPNALSPVDAPSVGALRDAGAVILGKTTTPEFGWKGLCDSPLTGITRNPWDTTRTSGGSSGGAAVSAATGMSVLGTGSDGGGSVRIPAAFCGLVGLKPTGSIVPIYPPSTGASLAHVGPITRSVRDAAHMMSVMTRPDAREVTPIPRDDRPWLDGLADGVVGLRIAFSPTYGFATDVDPQVSAAANATAQRLAGLGAHVELADPEIGNPREAFLTMWDALLARTLIDIPEDRLALSDPGLVATTNRGRAITAQQYLDADAVRVSVALAFNRLLQIFDLVLSPTVAALPFVVDQVVANPVTQQHWLDWTPFTYPLNLSRHPAVAVPVGLSREGLPLSVQIVGRHFDDRLVLRAACALESANPFPRWEGHARPAARPQQH